MENSTNASLVAEEDWSKIVPDDVSKLVVMIGRTYLIPIIGPIGLVANVLNFTVFLHMGFKDTINITLLSLALSDFMVILFMMWNGIGLSAVFMDPARIVLSYGATKHIIFMLNAFTRVSALLTLFVTIDRTLCVLLPLRVKQIVTRRVTIITVLSIYSYLIFFLVPFYSQLQFFWKTNERNRTVFYIVRPATRQVTATIGGVYSLGVTVQLLAYILTAVFSLLLTNGLRRQGRMRQQMLAQGGQHKSPSELSLKDQSAIKMIISVACIFIICCLFGTVMILLSSINSNISFYGRYSNTYNTGWAIANLGTFINCSVNFFIYFKMSSQFRKTFLNLFSVCRKG